MDGERLGADSPRSVRLARRMDSKAYRHSYVASHTRQFLARQMRQFRGDQAQTEFGNKIGKQQTVVSRLEDPNYGKWTLQTLFDVARSLDIAVLVRFVDFPTFLRSTRDMSDTAAHPAPYDQAAVDEVARKDQYESALRALFGPHEQTPEPERSKEGAEILSFRSGPPSPPRYTANDPNLPKASERRVTNDNEPKSSALATASS